MVELTVSMLAVWALAIAVFGRQTLGWAFDSPVLRRALRGRRFGTSIWLGWAAVTVGITRLIWSLGERHLNLSSLLVGSLLLVLGYAGVLLAALVVEDLREIFLVVAGKLRGNVPLDQWSEPSADEEQAERIRCAVSEAMAARHCVDSTHRCGGSFNHAARRQDSRHTRQHR